MNNRSRTALYCAAAAIMAVILLGNGWGRGRFLFGIDTFTLHLPFFMFAKKAWAMYHSLPLWMPDIFLGMPAIDSSNLMYFYPTNLLFILLPVPVEQAYVIDLLIHMAAAAFGMYLLLRRHRIGAQAAFFGALVYMFSGPLVTYAYNGHWPDIKALALAPFVLYFINRGIADKKVFFFLTAGLFMGLQFLGIGMQVGAYTYITAFIYGAYLLHEKKAGRDEIISCAVLFIAAAAAAALFSAPQFFPAQDYVKHSWRKDFPYGEFVEFSLPPAETLTLLLPQFFGLKDQMYWGELKGMAVTYYCGLAPLLLAFFAFFSAKHKRDAVFFLCLGVLFAVLSYGGYTPLYKLLYYLPVFNKFRNPARVMSMMPLVLSFMAAAGVNSLVSGEAGDRERNKKTLILAAKWLGSAAAILILFTARENVLKGIVSGLFAATRGRVTGAAMPEGADAAIAALIRQDALSFIVIGGLFLALVYARVSGKFSSITAFVLLLACLQFSDVYRIERQFISYKTIAEVAESNPAADHMMKSKGIFRAADLNFAWYPNKSMYYGLEFFAGFHAIIMDKMYSLLGNNSYEYININRLFNIRYYLNTGDPEEYKKWGLEKVVDGPVKLFEDKNYLPRAFFTDRVRLFNNDDEIIAYMKTPGFDPREALARDAIKPAENAVKEESAVEITGYTPDRIKIKARSNKDGVLVLSNMYYPRWKVMVDKKPERIYNIDYALSGVVLSAGEHELDFYYDGGFILACIFVMAAALAAYLAVYYFEFRRKKTQ